MRRTSLVGLLVAAALLLAACGSSGPDDTTTTAATGSSTEAPLTGTATVAAAASLTEAFEDIGAAFQDEHPGTKLAFTFDSSTTLADQILQGAPVDAFASADEANMERLTLEDLTKGDPVPFARNQLVIVTKPGNPAGITGLADLADAGVVALCGTEVPCGKAATKALEQAGVTIPETSVTRGQNVKATLAAVAEGDAVAGIVYVSDGKAAADSVDTVAIPDADNATVSYPIASLRTASNAALTQAFVDFVLSDAGQAILEDHGFLPPS